MSMRPGRRYQNRFGKRPRRRVKARKRFRAWVVATVAVSAIIAIWRGASVLRPNPHASLLPPVPFLPAYVRAGEAYGIPWPFLAAINEIETNYDRVRPMLSPAGAVGPMQFMPATWREYGADVLHPNRRGNPMNFLDSVFACARLLHQWGMTYDRTNAYWIERMAGSYDAGPGAWNNGSPETVHYREHAIQLYRLIGRDVQIPAADIRYWNRLSLAQIGAIAHEGAPLLSPGLPPVRELAANP